MAVEGIITVKGTITGMVMGKTVIRKTPGIKETSVMGMGISKSTW
jgi:hypothetical protein